MTYKNRTQSPRDFKNSDEKKFPKEKVEKTFRNREDHPVRRNEAADSGSDMPQGNETRPRLRGSGLLSEIRELDKDLLRLIVRRKRMLSRLPGGGSAEHEKELRTAWEVAASAISRDPRLVRQLFSLLQEIEVAPAKLEQAAAFNLAPSRKAVNIDLPAPTCDFLPRMSMALAAATGTVCTLHNVVLNDPVIECVKALNQIGARLRWEDDGRILCQEEKPVSGCNKPVLDKVIHAGDDLFNVFLLVFLMVTRPARLKIVGESSLKFVDLTTIRHFLPQLGARLTNVVPGQEGLPIRLESSALLPNEITVPADIPTDAVIALLLAATGWDRQVSFDLSRHPQGRAIAARMNRFLNTAGIGLTDSPDTTVLTITPGKANGLENVPAGISLTGAAPFLAMPVLTGGTASLHGNWDACERDQLDKILDLLRALGASSKLEKGVLTVSAQSPFGQDSAVEEQPAFDLSSCSHEIFPLALLLTLVPSIRNRKGILPKLPARADLDVIDEFLSRIGLTRNESMLSPTEPSDIPWASPSREWALALSLAAFLRPNIKLSNPGIVQSRLPNYWKLYNTLPVPVLPSAPTESSQDKTPQRPARRRVFASYTPESEMPDEIVYPDE